MWCDQIEKYEPKIFEISPHPLPLPSGERGRVRGPNKRIKRLEIEAGLI
jgi:hypothetical protein